MVASARSAWVLISAVIGFAAVFSCSASRAYICFAFSGLGSCDLFATDCCCAALRSLIQPRNPISPLHSQRAASAGPAAYLRLRRERPGRRRSFHQFCRRPRRFHGLGLHIIGKVLDRGHRRLWYRRNRLLRGCISAFDEIEECHRLPPFRVLPRPVTADFRCAGSSVLWTRTEAAVTRRRG